MRLISAILLIFFLGVMGPAAAELPCPFHCSEIRLNASGFPLSALLVNPQEGTVTEVRQGDCLQGRWQVQEMTADTVLLRDRRAGGTLRLRLIPRERLATGSWVSPSQWRRLGRDPREGQRQRVPTPRNPAREEQTPAPSFQFGLPGDGQRDGRENYRWGGR